ncbi:hypothetical protein [Frankia sp. Cr1]|nr:hypothetical protein [Frankia sp. Cr1]
MDLRDAATLLPPVRQVLFTFGLLQHVVTGQAQVLTAYTDRLFVDINR